MEITDAIQYLIEHNHRVSSSVVESWWKDTGKPEDILEANQLVLDELSQNSQGVIEKGANIKGKVVIGEATKIKKDSIIKGPVMIGKNCQIGPQTFTNYSHLLEICAG